MARKISIKKLIPIFVVIAVIVSYSLYNNHKPNEKAVNNKQNSEETSQNTTKANENKADQDKNQSENNSTAGEGKEQSKDDNSKPSDSKQTEEKTTDKSDADDEITASVQEANFGCTVEINVSSNLSSNYKYYQFYAENKAISNVESIEKNRTTLYPAQESGAEVKVKIFDENKKVIKTLDIKLNAK